MMALTVAGEMHKTPGSLSVQQSSYTVYIQQEAQLSPRVQHACLFV